MKKAVFESLGWVLLYILLQIVVFIAMSLFVPQGGRLMVGATAVTAFFVVLMLWFVAVRHNRVRMYFGRANMGCMQDWGVCFGLLVLFWVSSELIGRQFEQSPMAFMDEFIQDVGLGWLIMLMVIVAPIYEECLFRGAIFGRLYACQTQKSNTNLAKQPLFWQASLLSGALFALVHTQYDWFGVILIGMLAMILAWARVKTGGLILPIALHMVNNAMAMAVYLLERS